MMISDILSSNRNGIVQIATFNMIVILSLSTSSSAFIPGANKYSLKNSNIKGPFIMERKVIIRNPAEGSSTQIYSDKYDAESDANKWLSSDIPPIEDAEDWETALQNKKDGSFWSSFVPDDDSKDDNDDVPNSSSATLVDDDMEGEQWLDALSSIAAEEIEFINTEADRADKVRQMQDMGFNKETIGETLGVAIDDSLERDPDNEMITKFQEETKSTGFGMYVEDIEVDLQTVESHTTVEKDEETGENIRTQMVYVDEVTCIGCTNCAMIAQSTFFMEQEHGRARVFQQWGDDDETIQIAIETCPVDCIHYVPYDELERLEVERRDQNINFKARLVNQGEYGGGVAHRVGGSTVFTGQQQISGNMGSRCNNCPSRGCKNCPMYGIGKNPYFEKKEKDRKLRAAKKRMKEERENNNRSADL